jgi:hypothetical protein
MAGNPEYNAIRKAMRERYIELTGSRARGKTLFVASNKSKFSMIGGEGDIKVDGYLYAPNGRHYGVTYQHHKAMYEGYNPTVL